MLKMADSGPTKRLMQQKTMGFVKKKKAAEVLEESVVESNSQ